MMNNIAVGEPPRAGKTSATRAVVTKRTRVLAVPASVVLLAFFAAAAVWSEVRSSVNEFVVKVTDLSYHYVYHASEMLFAAVACLILLVVMRRREAKAYSVGVAAHISSCGLAASGHGDFLQDVALAVTTDAVVITKPDGVIEWVNAAFETMTGYPAAVAVGGTPRLFNSGLHGEEFYRDLWGTIGSGQVWRGEVTNRRSDGELYTIRQTITPIVDKDGSIRNYVAVHENVTDVLLAARAVEASQLRTEVMFDRAVDAILLVDFKGRCVDANIAACELSGYMRDELLRLTVTDLTAVDRQPDELAELWAGFSGGDAVTAGALIIRRKDGSELEAEYRMSLEVRPGVSMMVVRDVTRRNVWLRDRSTDAIFLPGEHASTAERSQTAER